MVATPGRQDHAELPVGVLTLSADLRIVSASRHVGELLELDPAALAGASIDVVLSTSARILFQTHVYPALLTAGRVEEVFLTLAGPGNETTPVLFNAVRGTGTDEHGYLGTVVRIRARARWEQELLVASRELKEERAASERLALDLSKAIEELQERHEAERRRHEFRDVFIGVISHELRTPITTIYGMGHILRARHGSMSASELAAYLNDIVDEADRLRRLTEDLLVLSRAEAQKLEVALEPVLLDHVVPRVVAQEGERTADHALRVTTTGDVPLVLGEETYVEQVLRNLVGNAIKYSAAGSNVDVEVRPEDGGASVRVLDDGPGLGAHGGDRLFDVFHREPEAIRQTSGAGIGLFVSRALVEAMGGRIWARSNALPRERGAEFGFWLPTARGEGFDAG